LKQAIEAIGMDAVHWYSSNMNLNEMNTAVELTDPPKAGGLYSLLFRYTYALNPTVEEAAQANIISRGFSKQAKRAWDFKDFETVLEPVNACWAVWCHPLIRENGLLFMDDPDEKWEDLNGNVIPVMPQLIESITFVKLKPESVSYSYRVGKGCKHEIVSSVKVLEAITISELCSVVAHAGSEPCSLSRKEREKEECFKYGDLSVCFSGELGYIDWCIQTNKAQETKLLIANASQVSNETVYISVAVENANKTESG